jgi:general secretion pathway protein H
MRAKVAPATTRILPVGSDTGARGVSPPKLRRGTSGFTLVELILALLIMALAYGLVAPRIGSSSTGLEIQAATQQVAAGLRRARTLAIQSRRDSELAIDVSNKFFSVTGDKKHYQLPASLDYAMYTASSQQIDGKIGMIRFLPDGSSSGGQVIVRSGAFRQAVNVDWITGRTKIQDIDR